MSRVRSIHWTEAEWQQIQFWADVARNPRPLPVQGLTARGAQVRAAQVLRGMATNSEILLQRQAEARS